MDTPKEKLCNIVSLVKSWTVWRSEPATVSRDFWMPDQSCRVCYECDSPFTLFNRRHHCRLCGRIFCGKCTSNSVPVSPGDGVPREEWPRIRVCNYCFKQWQQGIVTLNNGFQVANRDLAVAASPTSLASTKSSGIVDCSSFTFGSTLSYQQLQQGSGICLHGSSFVMGTNPDIQGVVEARSNDIVQDVEDPSRDQYLFSLNRSDDEDDEYSLYAGTPHFPRVSDFYCQTEFDEMGYDFSSEKGHQHGENNETKSLSDSMPYNSFNSRILEGNSFNSRILEGNSFNSRILEGNSFNSRILEGNSFNSRILEGNSFNSRILEGNSFNSRILEDIPQLGKKDELDNAYECETPSSIFVAEDIDIEPVDFENNGLLWLPPEPEDEEDERESLLLEDDDGDGVGGEWGYCRQSSNNYGSGEQGPKERLNEGHKIAMKNVVDGHFRALVSNLLKVENLSEGEDDDKESWLEIISALSWEAVTLLKPDTSKSGGMDPGGYVKVQCVASGHRCESMVVKGVVCQKNVAHRRMISKIVKPRILILGGALEYQRVSNLLSSFATLLQQEMDHLKMAVAKIDAHQPDVLLVEKSVSRFAQEYLLAKNISLVLNMKKPLLERIARCSGSQIVPSIDHLTSQRLGYCETFHVEKLLEEHGSAGQGGKKMIVLRGANGDELKKVKHVVQYGVFAAYHLALETSFLADEGASLPEHPINSPMTVALPDPASKGRSISTISGFTNCLPENPQEPQLPSPFLAPSINSSFLDKPEKTESTCFPNESSYKSTQPVDPTDYFSSAPPSGECVQEVICNDVSSPKPFEEKYGIVSTESLMAETSALRNGCEAVYNGHHLSESIGEDGAATHRKNNDHVSVPSQETKGLVEEPGLSKEEFLPVPSDHQSILVSVSSRCVWKGTVCERAHLFRIKYYGNFDKPLGRFLRDQLFDQSYRCLSCDMPSEAHVRCYTHRQGTLTISVKQLPEFLLPGEKEGKIWMWHRCLRCPRTNGFPPATRRVVMSDAAWGLSLGKFLELSFSNHAAASRVASCGHSLHRDCLRFYGFGNMVACFRYASIDVNSVYLPPFKLHFSSQNQEWIQREIDEVARRAELLFSEVLNALDQIAEKRSVTGQVTELKGMLQKEKVEFEESLQKTLKREAKKGIPNVDILEINRLRRQLLFQSYMWDHRLIYIASPDNNSFQDGLSCSLSIEKESLQKTLKREAKKGIPNVDILEINRLRRQLLFQSYMWDHRLIYIASPDNNSFQDGLSCSLSIEKVAETNDFSKSAKRICSADSVLVEAMLNKTSPPNHVEPSYEKEDRVLSAGTNSHNNKPMELEVNVRRALSEGHFPMMPNLSDTLDAAWIGENKITVADGLDSDEDRRRSMSRSDSLENSIGWLRMPFLNFYRAFKNKNFLASTQKLDTLGEYKPVYVSSFRKSELQEGARLLLPMGVNDTVVPVFNDEPTSIIAYALVSQDYHAQLSDDVERVRDVGESFASFTDSSSFLSVDESLADSFRSFGLTDDGILSMTGSRSPLAMDPVSNTKSMHPKISFTDDGPLGKVKYCVICYYAKRFEALRKICCPSELDFVRSLSRCKKWGAQGGKSKVFFAKTLDDRFVIKQVTKTELESFIKFATGYFKYLSESISTRSPTCLAKILGIYQVSLKHLKGGKESRIDVLVMENLLFGRNLSRLYDLKGSTRSRYNPDSSGSNKVLLDQNLIEAMPTSPIFVGKKAKRLLERAVWNDTSFLASVDVMDYSLLVGVDEEKHELVLGIIDFMRQYTWDKHLETWVKASRILGGTKNASPTVISPQQYKKRFRKAMSTYFLMLPDQWSPPAAQPQPDDENGVSAD